jgi:hypothetical protein
MKLLIVQLPPFSCYFMVYYSIHHFNTVELSHIQTDPKVTQPMGSVRRFVALCTDP